MKLINLILIISFIIINSLPSIAQKSDWERKYDDLNDLYISLGEDLEESEATIEILRKKIKIYSDIVAIFPSPVSPPKVPPAKSYESEYENAKVENDKLGRKNRLLKQNESRLEAEITELKRLLAIEIRKVENLEYEKQQLETEMAVMEIRIDDLEVANRDLNSENRKLDRHVVKLQRDSIKKETKIAKQGERIVDLEADKERILHNRTVLKDLARKQKKQINEIKNKHKVDKLQLASSYLGLNYNLTAFNNPIISNNVEQLDRGIISNLSLSWYNSLLGGYFSIPYNYCSNNPFANCPEDNMDTYFSVKDIESVKMAMDIKGVYYEDLKFAYTENHFKTYSAGLHFAAFRYLYVSVGTSILKGSSWDLYEGDLSGFENIVTKNDVMPIKNNDGYYTLNYNNHSIVKPSAGVAFVVPFRGFNSNRDNNKQIRSKTLSSYNYKSGFQLEVGYDWLFDDFYAKAGLHYKLWNYDQDILDDPDYQNLASNEIRRGLEIIIEEDKKSPEKVDDKEINRGMKIIVETLIGRSVYFQSEADELNIQGKFEKADTAQLKSDKLADLACCLTKEFLNKGNDTKLSCSSCNKKDLSFLYEFLPDYTPEDKKKLTVREKRKKLRIGGDGRETAILKYTKKFFEKHFK